MNKYAIYTEGDVYPVLEKDGQYYIGVPGTGHFSGQWKFLGVRERLKNSRTIIKPEDALKITDWKFKNGSPKYQVVDLDHGSVRTWAGTSADQQLRSFDTISDSGFNIATKTDKDEEIVLEESKKYAIYATYGEDGVYNSKLVDTVDSEEQAVDRVAELQTTGVGASYEEIETKNEECSQASGVASGTNGKIDSFPINPKEMERQRLKENIDNPYFVVEDIGGLYIMAGPFKTIEEARNKRKEQIEEYNLKEEADIIFAWSWNRISKYYIERYGEDNPYNNYQEFINGAECAPYYKEEKLEESKNIEKELDWIYDEDEKLYHCEIDNWYFNIYELEDGTYNLIVDYDEDELQDLDDIFDTLEEAKKKAQEIFNKGISEYNDTDFAGFEYETESKDLTKTLQEMALLEDYEEDKTISPQKQKFIDYCKDKIEDLGDVEIYDEDYEENIQYHRLMHTEGIREFNDLYIIANFDDYENENLIAINNENKIVINTPMMDCNGYASTMQFDKIDKKFYDQLMDYWDDIYMDEMIEEE